MAPNTDQSSRIYSPPGRRAYWLAAVGYTALAIYGSLVPLRYEPLAWTDAVSRFRELPHLSLEPDSRADWVSNVLLFVPLTYLFMGALTVDTRARVWRALAGVGVVLGGSLLSIALEFTQLWFPTRTVSQNDVIAETLGGLAGTALWLLVGQTMTSWIRRDASASRGRPPFEWLLELYLIGFLIYSVLPLDLTISSGELWGKFKDGKITIVPFTDVSGSWLGIYGSVRDVAVLVPIGLLIATWRVPAGRVRALPTVAIAGGLVAAGVELLQLLVLSRYTSSTDIILGAIGATFGGWWMAGRVRGHTGASAVVAPSPGERRVLAWAGAAAAWAVIIAAISWAPFEISGTHDEWRARYQQFWAVPFANLYYGSEYNAVSEVLRKTILFGVFGALLARAVLALRLPEGVRRLFGAAAVALAAALAAGIELAQVFLPPHVSDITDVLLAVLGAAIGVTIVMRMAGRATTSSARVRRARP